MAVKTRYERRSASSPSSVPTTRGRLVGFAIAAAMAAALKWEGRRWWCRCAHPRIWVNDPRGSHNSQHLADAYTLTHIHHGILLYASLRTFGTRLHPDIRFALATALEALWECVENSSGAISHYRRTTAAEAYEGDSIANSLGDLTACAVGYELAARLPISGSIATFVGLEAFLLAAYRDNFTLAVLTGAFPLPAVKRWQQGE